MVTACICDCGALTPAARFCRACGNSLDGKPLVEVLHSKAIEALRSGQFVHADRWHGPGLFRPMGRKHYTLN